MMKGWWHRSQTGWTVGFMVVAVSVVAAFGGWGSAQASPLCVAKGPRSVVYPVHGGSASTGNTYLVQSMSQGAAPLSCTRLRAALARIFHANPMPWPAASRARPQGVRLKGAPKGFTCSGSSTNPSGKDVNNITGICRTTILGAGGSGQLFNWSPVDPRLIR
jgi:hypothetical protein